MPYEQIRATHDIIYTQFVVCVINSIHPENTQCGRVVHHIVVVRFYLFTHEFPQGPTQQ